MTPTPASVHVILQSRTRDRTEYDVTANGEVIGQVRLIDGEWRSLMPMPASHESMHDGINLLLQQWAIQFN